jgi:hypothetical protein
MRWEGERKKTKTVHQDVDYYLSLLFSIFLVRWLFEDWGEDKRRKSVQWDFAFFFPEERQIQSGEWK